MLIAASTTPAFADGESLARLSQVADELARYGVIENRAGRDKDHKVFAAPAGTFLFRAILPIVCCEFLILPERGKCIERGAHLEDDVAAFAAIAAIGTAAR